MKSKNFVSSKNNGFVGQFKSLNSEEMNNLRGGTKPVPPVPPSPGEDFPIILSSVTTTTNIPLPVLVVPTSTTTTLVVI